VARHCLLQAMRCGRPAGRIPSFTEHNLPLFNNMSRRRDNRVAAVQFLYMWEANPPESIRDNLCEFFGTQENPREYYSFAEELITGTIEHITEVDDIIKEYAKNWDFKRIARVDLAILRLAIYEMLYRKDIPPVVSINEAIDLSKTFSIPDAKRFINGILDQFKLKLDRPLREAEM
jgi:N utilization substance protein B